MSPILERLALAKLDPAPRTPKPCKSATGKACSCRATELACPVIPRQALALRSAPHEGLSGDRRLVHVKTTNTITDMNTKQEAVRPLNRLERIRLRLRRCPLCRRRTSKELEDVVSSWRNHPQHFASGIGAVGAGGHGRMLQGRIALLDKRIVSVCLRCQRFFFRGWVYRRESDHPSA